MLAQEPRSRGPANLPYVVFLTGAQWSRTGLPVATLGPAGAYSGFLRVAISYLLVLRRVRERRGIALEEMEGRGPGSG